MEKREMLKISIKNSIRSKHGSIKAFSKKAGLSNQSLNNILNGRRNTFENIYKLAVGLGWENKTIEEISETVYSLKCNEKEGTQDGSLEK